MGLCLFLFAPQASAHVLRLAAHFRLFVPFAHTRTCPPSTAGCTTLEVYLIRPELHLGLLHHLIAVCCAYGETPRQGFPPSRREAPSGKSCLRSSCSRARKCAGRAGSSARPAPWRHGCGRPLRRGQRAQRARRGRRLPRAAWSAPPAPARRNARVAPGRPAWRAPRPARAFPPPL